MSTPSAVRGAPATPITAAGVLTDGLYAGVIGAVLVALWFLALDIAAGHPFYTPHLLGTWVIRGQQAAPGAAIDPAMVAAYTAVHFLAFVAVGTVASYLVALLHRNPKAIIGLIFLFIFFEVGFFAFNAALGGGLLGRLGPWAVGIGNLVAAVGMATYLWVRHPHIKESLGRIWEE
jgi:hypothetical protein